MQNIFFQSIKKTSLNFWQNFKQQSNRVWEKAKPHLQQTPEYLELLWIKLCVWCKNLLEYVKVVFKYYGCFSFMKIDLLLLLSYLFKNPYKISKDFLTEKGEQQVHAYGETPLTTLEMIAKECQIQGKDTVFELGSGRGRTCFWLHEFIGCRVVGIEYIGEFVERGNRIIDQLSVKGVSFRKESMEEADFSGGTVFYLYGTCLEEKTIKILIDKFAKLPVGTKIITVSYSLNVYTDQPLFEVMKRFPAEFTWGRGDVYLHYKK